MREVGIREARTLELIQRIRLEHYSVHVANSFTVSVARILSNMPVQYTASIDPLLMAR